VYRFSLLIIVPVLFSSLISFGMDYGNFLTKEELVTSVEILGMKNHPDSERKFELKSRAGVLKACLECRKKHVKCSFNRPCERCVENGLECVDVPKKKRKRKLKGSGEIVLEKKKIKKEPVENLDHEYTSRFFK